MPRVHFVKKARKPIPNAGIEVGDSYYHWKHRVGRSSIKRVSKTPPTRSQLTLSEFYGTLYDLEDNFDPGSDKESAVSALEELKGSLEDLASEQEDKRNNMPDSLQESPSGELLQERADALNELVNTLDDAIGEVASMEYDDEEYENEEDFERSCADVAREKVDDLDWGIS